MLSASKKQQKSAQPDYLKAAQAKQRRKKVTYPKPFSFRPKDENERKRVLQAAEGMSISAYFRYCIAIAEGKKPCRSASYDKSELARALALLGQSEIADHLKHLRYLADNGALLLDPDSVAQLKAACDHVQDIRTALIASLGLRKGRRK